MTPFDEVILRALVSLYRTYKSPVSTIRLSTELNVAERSMRFYLSRLERLNQVTRPAPRTGKTSRGGWMPAQHTAA